uniref:Uncharacterized protein n=1 Tax=Mycena chlorophos TaxID=658473 RepID=A0ABQ0L1N9_MYCCL|nr:predicted protein [Mycena chlorophos]
MDWTQPEDGLPFAPSDRPYSLSTTSSAASSHYSDAVSNVQMDDIELSQSASSVSSASTQRPLRQPAPRPAEGEGDQYAGKKARMDVEQQPTADYFEIRERRARESRDKTRKSETENRELRDMLRQLSVDFRRLEQHAATWERGAQDAAAAREQAFQNDKQNLESQVGQAHATVQKRDEEVRDLKEHVTQQANNNHQLRRNLAQAQKATESKPARRSSLASRAPIRGLETPIVRLVPVPNRPTRRANPTRPAAPVVEGTTSSPAAAVGGRSVPSASATPAANGLSPAGSRPDPEAPSAPADVDASTTASATANEAFLKRHAAKVADAHNAGPDEESQVLRMLRELQLDIKALKEERRSEPAEAGRSANAEKPASTVNKDSKKSKDGLKKQRLPKLRLNEVNAALRVIISDLFGIKLAADYALHLSASAEDVTACAKGKAEPDGSDLRWDFNKQTYLHSRWNQLIIEAILDTFFVENPGMIEDDAEMRDLLSIVIIEKVKNFRKYWDEAQPTGEESVEEAQIRAAQIHQQRQLNSRSNSSKFRKLHKRIATASRAVCILVKSGSPDVERWKWIISLLKKLDATGMSSEEATASPITKLFSHYEVLVCEWCEPEIVDYMRLVDLQSAHFDMTRVGAKSSERRRSADAKNGVSAPPRGLPESLYNASWLADQDLDVVAKLNISKTVFEFFEESL